MAFFYIESEIDMTFDYISEIKISGSAVRKVIEAKVYTEDNRCYATVKCEVPVILGFGQRTHYGDSFVTKEIVVEGLNGTGENKTRRKIARQLCFRYPEGKPHQKTRRKKRSLW